MHYKYSEFVLTIVATNEKNYKDCIAYIKNIFNEIQVTVSQSKNLANFVLDIYFNCTLEDLNFMKKKNI